MYKCLLFMYGSVGLIGIFSVLMFAFESHNRKIADFFSKLLIVSIVSAIISLIYTTYNFVELFR